MQYFAYIFALYPKLQRPEHNFATPCIEQTLVTIIPHPVISFIIHVLNWQSMKLVHNLLNIPYHTTLIGSELETYLTVRLKVSFTVM